MRQNAGSVTNIILLFLYLLLLRTEESGLHDAPKRVLSLKEGLLRKVQALSPRSMSQTCDAHILGLYHHLRILPYHAEKSFVCA